MNNFINIGYITGGIKQLMTAEFLRGIAWGLGFWLISAIPILWILHKENSSLTKDR